MSKRGPRNRRRNRQVGLGQGLVYVVSGLWPVLSIRTFERVTGPKSEDWLVRTIGGLLAVIGVVLARPALVRRRPGAPRPRPDRLLGAGAAAVLGTAGVVGVLAGRLRPVYLLDAAMEAGFIVAWLAAGPDPDPRHDPGGHASGRHEQGRHSADGGHPANESGRRPANESAPAVSV